MTDTRRRVKLYALNADRQWDDKGTGHVSSSYVDRLKGMSLLVRAESDGSTLLESRIQPDTAYQKQQDTLIVWSEGDNYDLALSFQEKVGCDEIWAKICQIQGKDPSVDHTQEPMEEEDERFEETSDAIELPPCEVDKLEELNELIASCLVHPMKRERLALALENEDYIKKLLKLFHQCEETHNVKSLHKLHEIFKNVFLLNKNPLFEVMLGEETLFDVIGVFEYDPNQPQPKRHREYLKSVSRFKEVIPFGNAELINKIHQTYRVQYIQDVVLPTPTVFEENMLSTLSSFIFFNKVEIVSLIQEDDKFLRELFAQITDESTNVDKRKDLVLFLKEFCTFSQTLQPQARENFFKALSTLGVLQTLEVTLSLDNIAIRSASVDILTYVVEYSPSMVREYALKQEGNCDEDQYIINVMIDQMICDPDPDLGMAVQLSSILRLLLDPENMITASAVNKSEKNDFLVYFYKHCMHVLVAPVLAATSDERPIREDGRMAQLLSIILELMSFCVEHHLYHIRNYIIQRELLKEILVLMMSRHTFLVLSALRFLRKIIGLKDEFYNRHIINANLFAPVVEAFKQNNGRYNLLDSAIIEVFEFIKTEEIKSLCVHIVEVFGKYLDQIQYVGTFKGLRQHYEQYQDKLKDRNSLESSPVIMRNERFRRDPRQLDEDEEIWFNNDEEEDGMDNNLQGSLSYKLEAEFDQFNKKISEKKSTLSLSYADLENVKKYNDLDVKTMNRSTSPRRTTPLTASQTSPSLPHVEVQTTRKGGLVDYPDEDSDEEDNGDEGNLAHTKRARLSS
ncbi:serine/threonine-protein phosphatase 4 regulatory subunit 3A-like isoform X2 [Panonychus citri]|uniref:serine/threonine-protein phosphatase 4 regulatory subunit 3A-like isoform X2 n=1 Tax=Panonychus citri TaxID=50023 RepID=UPI0023074446|nr:serine/threonine-protein phosphatase 4 regulatory subunit 3A-like isoform X2 [Panonychus citri]